MAGLANVTYEQHNLLDTLLLLNKSLSLADPNSNLPSCCYGKRAVVFFDLNEYDLCIADINLSIQTNKRDPLVTLPPFKAFTEYMRDKHHHPEADDDPTNFFQLSHPANPRLPCLADCLQLNTNEKYGRHIITTRALNVGDIVGVTDFSFIFFDKRARLHHCSHCTTSATKLRLIPCPNCDSGEFKITFFFSVLLMFGLERRQKLVALKNAGNLRQFDWVSGPSMFWRLSSLGMHSVLNELSVCSIFWEL